MRRDRGWTPTAVVVLVSLAVGCAHVVPAAGPCDPPLLAAAMHPHDDASASEPERSESDDEYEAEEAARVAEQRRATSVTARRVGVGFTAAGATMLAIGVVGLGMVGAGYGKVTRIDDQVRALGTDADPARLERWKIERARGLDIGEAGLWMSILGVGLGGLFVWVGVRNLRHSQRLLDGLARVRAAPVVGKGHAGLALAWRF